MKSEVQIPRETSTSTIFNRNSKSLLLASDICAHSSVILNASKSNFSAASSDSCLAFSSSSSRSWATHCIATRTGTRSKTRTQQRHTQIGDPSSDAAKQRKRGTKGRYTAAYMERSSAPHTHFKDSCVSIAQAHIFLSGQSSRPGTALIKDKTGNKHNTQTRTDDMTESGRV